jgi:hypothetical protein
MPTAARLVGALSLAVLAFVVSKMIIAEMVWLSEFGYFTEVNVALGLIFGWRVIGRNAGHGMRDAVSSGIGAMFVMVLSGLFLQSGNTMIDQSMDRRYDGPVEAVLDIALIGYENFLIMARPHILITLLLGGILCGMLAEWAWRRWR